MSALTHALPLKIYHRQLDGQLDAVSYSVFSLIRPLQPSTKAPVGEKDENITPDEARKIVGAKYADRIESLALKIYKAAHEYAVRSAIALRISREAIAHLFAYNRHRWSVASSLPTPRWNSVRAALPET